MGGKGKNHQKRVYISLISETHISHIFSLETVTEYLAMWSHMFENVI